MGARENECKISQNDILHTKFSEFYLWFDNSFELDIYCRGLPLELLAKDDNMFPLGSCDTVH